MFSISSDEGVHEGVQGKAPRSFLSFAPAGPLEACFDGLKKLKKNEKEGAEENYLTIFNT